MRIPQLFVVIAAMLAAVTVTSAQEKPNFSGRWVVVSPAADAGQEQTVTQTAATLTTGHASEGHGHRAVYKLDGTENRNVLTSHDEDIVTLSKASWSGTQLTITSDTTYPDGRKWHTVQTWSLESEGRLAVEFSETGMNAAPMTTRRIYTRRQPPA
jgi:hypothetical protein